MNIQLYMHQKVQKQGSNECWIELLRALHLSPQQKIGILRYNVVMKLYIYIYCNEIYAPSKCTLYMYIQFTCKSSAVSIHSCIAYIILYTAWSLNVNNLDENFKTTTVQCRHRCQDEHGDLLPHLCSTIVDCDGKRLAQKLTVCFSTFLPRTAMDRHLRPWAWPWMSPDRASLNPASDRDCRLWAVPWRRPGSCSNHSHCCTKPGRDMCNQQNNIHVPTATSLTAPNQPHHFKFTMPNKFMTTLARLAKTKRARLIICI